jgi:hypothetical protein
VNDLLMTVYRDRTGNSYPCSLELVSLAAYLRVDPSETCAYAVSARDRQIMAFSIACL